MRSLLLLTALPLCAQESLVKADQFGLLEHPARAKGRLYSSIDVLYWVATERGLEYAFVNSGTQTIHDTA